MLFEVAHQEMLEHLVHWHRSQPRVKADAGEPSVIQGIDEGPQMGEMPLECFSVRREFDRLACLDPGQPSFVGFGPAKGHGLTFVSVDDIAQLCDPIGHEFGDVPPHLGCFPLLTTARIGVGEPVEGPGEVEKTVGCRVDPLQVRSALFVHEASLNLLGPQNLLEPARLGQD